MSDIIYDLILLVFLFVFTKYVLFTVRGLLSLRRDRLDYEKGQRMLNMGLPKGKE